MKVELEPDSPQTDAAPATPSRLVNLRVHNSDLESPAAPDSAPVEPPVVAEPTPEPTPEVPTETPVVESISASEPETKPAIMHLSEESSLMAARTKDAAIDTKALAVSIAADYSAASLTATASSLPVAVSTAPSTPIDEIARVASEAIASIRRSTDPDDIASQVASLKKFSATVRSNADLPEMTALSDTIDKFLSIAEKSMNLPAKKPEETIKVATKATAKAAKPAVKKTVRRPAKAVEPIDRSPRAVRTPARVTKAVRMADHRAAKRPAARRSAKNDAMSDTALRSALASVATMEDIDRHVAGRRHRRTRVRHVLIATACTVATLAGILWFVGSNIPDVSIRVAAMQAGVDASYPSYTPQGFSLGDVDAEYGRIALSFSDASGSSFILVEEKSSWDSAALERNFVKSTWQDDYTTTHEQGITIYIHGSNAAWVNGGVLYKIVCPDNCLTKKQLRNIVTSMQ